MGLDAVELVLAVEDEFEVAIEDSAAPGLVTPRLLANYVLDRLGGKLRGDEGRCLSQSAFYRIRSALVRQFGASRNEVRPDSRIEAFLRGDIRRQWAELRTAIDATQLPGLQCRKLISYPLLTGLPLCGGALLYSAGVTGWPLAIAAFALWISAAVVTARLSDLIPANLATVGALAPYVRIKDQQAWTRDYVLQRVMQLTSLQLGIPIERTRPDDHFVNDLGLA